MFVLNTLYILKYTQHKTESILTVTTQDTTWIVDTLSVPVPTLGSMD